MQAGDVLNTCKGMDSGNEELGFCFICKRRYHTSAYSEASFLLFLSGRLFFGLQVS